MSRTHHHSYRWGYLYRFSQKRTDRGRIGPRRDAGEAPGWHVRLYDERPGRRGDTLLIHRIIRGFVDVENACFERTGGRKPHSYYW